jgi:hypothetical protein
MNSLDTATIIKRSILSVLITTFFSLNAQAGENCSMRSDGLSSFREISSNLKKVTWYNDRDNSMTKPSTEEGVGAAMLLLILSVVIAKAYKFVPEFIWQQHMESQMNLLKQTNKVVSLGHKLKI